MPPTADEFRHALHARFRGAAFAGKSVVEIRSGDLHEEAGGYPGLDHRMPSCCSVMRGEMASGDAVVQQPPQGDGANLVIRFRFPRAVQV